MSDTSVGNNYPSLEGTKTPLPQLEKEDYSRLPRLRNVIAIAFPMVISQASETVNLFVDRLFLSRLGKLYIAGAMTGGITAFCVMSFFIGIAGFVNAIVAQHHGAGEKQKCSQATVQAIYLNFVGWPLILFTIPLVEMLLTGLGHLPEQVAIEMSYFRILIYGSILGLTRQAITGFFIGLGRTRIVMFANCVSMLVNIPANWILIFGKFGMPALGIQGAAAGTLLGNAVALGVLFAVYFSKHYREVFNTIGDWRFNRKMMRILLEFGAPAGGEFFLNVFAFNLFIQLMHSYNADTAVAVTIALNYDMLAFVPMLGIGFAATTLSGRYVGARNIPGAERATRLNLLTAWTVGSIFVIIFVAAAQPLVNLFSSGLEDRGVNVAPMARTMLRLAAIYILADATQLVLSGSLRGAGDTKFIMWISVIMHWVFVGILWYAVKIAMISPISSWIIFIGFVVLLGCAMFLRYRFGKWRQLSLVS